MFELKNFHAIKIGLASPEVIRSWSKGEVKTAETVHYKTSKPEKDGLFCQVIFGPVKDGHCQCGKYNKIKFKGVVCSECGVEPTQSKVRRERMGHIELTTPVAHIWYYKGNTSKISIVADMAAKEIENLLYYRVVMVQDPGENILLDGKPLEKYQMILPNVESELYDRYGDDSFKTLSGGEAVKYILKNIDLDKVSKELKEEIAAIAKETSRTTSSNTKYSKLVKRLDLIESFRRSNTKPEWMILDVIPVLPADLRPLIDLDGGKKASSDLNDLYRKVIITNKRVKDSTEAGCPSVILYSQKRELQEAVDALIDNEKKAKPSVSSSNNKVLKSLTSYLKGKQGRFRQNLLGKRVDYSGRSVIVVGPELKMYECGLPKEMAKELFKPFIRAELEKRGKATRKDSKEMVERGSAEVYDILVDVIKDHPVLLNRAPTLHRLGIQAFQPVLVDGNAIKLHPLVCTAFNADFDGDQMAVHVPLSQEAQAEARYLMLSTNNILKLSDGSSVVSPTQDMLLGSYYLTLEKELEDKRNMRVFSSKDEAIMAFNLKQITIQEQIKVRLSDIIDGKKYSKIITTTVGKIIFNSYIPQDLGFVKRETPEQKLDLEINGTVDKSLLGEIILRCYKLKGATETSRILDEIKSNGYKYSTLVALTANIYDMEIPKEKENIIKEANRKTLKCEEEYVKGRLTQKGRKKQVIKVWEKAKDECIEAVKKNKNKYNDIWLMADSGARGNIGQIAQIVSMKGLVVSTSGVIELPIKASFREGLSVLEYFIASHTSRKTLSDTALKTADSGYLTRRLVDVAHDVIIREEDCKTSTGSIATTIEDANGGKPIIELKDRIKGRFTVNDVINPQTGEIIVEADTMISDEKADEIQKAGIKKVEIRTLIKCLSKQGVCAKCYGRSMANSDIVQIGDAVGVIAAQSIGEPGTQLTMRTFHSGGVASSQDITQGLPRVQELFDKRLPKAKAILASADGTVQYTKDSKEIIIIRDDKKEDLKYDPKLLNVIVKNGDKVKKGDALTAGSKDLDELNRLSSTAVEEYIMREVLNIYKTAGVPVNPKHIEIIIRQMTKKVKVELSGASDLLPNELIDRTKHLEITEEMINKGIDDLPQAKRVIQGITKAALSSDSFLSAASFQETPRILTEAAIKGRIDYLRGLKENVILGKLIPAGTGLEEYQNIYLKKKENVINDVQEEYEEQTTNNDILEDDIDEIDDSIFN